MSQIDEIKGTYYNHLCLLPLQARFGGGRGQPRGPGQAQVGQGFAERLVDQDAAAFGAFWGRAGAQGGAAAAAGGARGGGVREQQQQGELYLFSARLKSRGRNRIRY